MNNLDILQRRLSQRVNQTHHDLYLYAKNEISKPFNVADMYAFQNKMLDLSNANWASSQYTQLKHGLRKTIIDINH